MSLGLAWALETATRRPARVKNTERGYEIFFRGVGKGSTFGKVWHIRLNEEAQQTAVTYWTAPVWWEVAFLAAAGVTLIAAGLFKLLPLSAGNNVALIIGAALTLQALACAIFGSLPDPEEEEFIESALRRDA